MADNNNFKDYDFDLFSTGDKEKYSVSNWDETELFENPADLGIELKTKNNSSKEDIKNIFKSLKKRPKIATVFEWMDVIVAALMAVVIIFTFIFRIVAIDGDSMNNTLFGGERVIITDLFYEPAKGDVVVISRNTDNSAKPGSYEEPIIKRIIATERDVVDINFETGEVSVNGEILKEPYIKEPTYTYNDVKFPVRVPENCVFVLGDNRNNSKDSRFSEIGEQGMINEKYILGKAILKVFPINKFGGIE